MKYLQILFVLDELLSCRYTVNIKSDKADQEEEEETSLTRHTNEK